MTHTVLVVVADEGGETTTELQVSEGEVVLLGRAPTLETVEGAPARCRAVELSAPSVSANHAALWLSGGTLQVRDLGSRNGTWVHAQRLADATTPVEVIHLGTARVIDEPGDRPRDPTWVDGRDFGRAVAHEVRSWLAARGIEAQVELTSATPTPEHDEPGLIPLHGTESLRVRFTSTVDGRWRARLKTLWSWVQQQNELLRSTEQLRGEGLVLASPPIRRALALVVTAARRDARVLLVGPSGSGKEGLARAYHRVAAPEGPFVAVNCSLFRKELLQSQLFGAEAGAFTGSTRRIVGAVERAQGGTLFLDEIGDLDEEAQPALLRFLDRGEYERLGDYGVTRKAEVCIVAATNKDLRAAVLRGAFRSDLWFRLAQEVIDVPPLKDRPEDVRAYLSGVKLRTGTGLAQALEPAARTLLETHGWAGNFRELANFAARVAAHDEPRLTAAFCASLLAATSLTPVVAPVAPRSAGGLDWAAIISEACRAYAEDHGAPPHDWDAVKALLEKYLKPLAFAGLSGATALADPAAAEVQALAATLNADRGTAAKQLARFVERFRR